MNMRFDIQMEGLQITQRHTIDKQKKVLWLSMHKMEELAKRFAPVDRGHLRRNINLHPITEGAKEYILSAAVAYAEDLEYGNTPRNVPLLPLIEWVERKGIRTGENVYAFAKSVQKKIKREGVNAQPFFRPANLEVNTIWLPMYWNRVMNSATA